MDQPALITFDALPDTVLKGKIVKIAPKSDDGSGANYKVTLRFDDAPPAQLRWGMTAFVDIDLSE